MTCLPSIAIIQMYLDGRTIESAYIYLCTGIHTMYNTNNLVSHRLSCLFIHKITLLNFQAFRKVFYLFIQHFWPCRTIFYVTLFSTCPHIAGETSLTIKTPCNLLDSFTNDGLYRNAKLHHFLYVQFSSSSRVRARKGICQENVECTVAIYLQMISKRFVWDATYRYKRA